MRDLSVLNRPCYRFAAGMLTVFLLATSIVAQSSDSGKKEKGDSEKSATAEKLSPAESAKAEQVAKAFLVVQKAVESNDLTTVQSLSSPKAFKEFYGQQLVISLMYAEESPELADLLKEHELGTIDPEKFFDANTYEEYNARLAKIFDRLPAENRLKILAKILQARDDSEEEESFHEFTGQITKTEFDEQGTATILVQLLAKDADEEILKEMEIDADDAGNQPVSPPHYFDFVKTDGKWVFVGINLPKTEAAMDQFFESTQDELPLIEDISLKGTAYSGKKIDLADFKGKVVLVDFWGTWCPPCVESLPKLKKLHKKFEKKGLVILGIAVDEKSDLDKFFKKTPLPWESIVDPEGDIAYEYDIEAFPTTLLIDKSGDHVASNLEGDELEDEIKHLLGEKE